MSARLIAAAALLLSASSALAQSADEVAAGVPILERGKPAPPSELAADTPMLGGTVIHSERIFAEPMGYRPLRMDIYRPAKPIAAKRPLLIWVHGGGWVAGTPQGAAAYADWPGVLARMAARGYVVAAVSYRLAKEAPFPAAIRDVKAGIRWLRSQDAAFGIDTAKVGIWGESAGGHLIGVAATTCGVAKFDPVDERRRRTTDVPAATPPSDCVQAAVGWFGIYDFNFEGPVKIPPQPPEDPTRLFVGCTTAQCTTAQKTWVSPVTYVDKTDAPMLLIHGDADVAVPYQQSERMAAVLKAAGVPVETLILPGANHGWHAKTPEATAAAHRKALAATIAYFDRTFGPQP
ncbi:alpha/beta hydrolase [Sphingomonas populi]|uniref:Alpha/beta hydrolase n=1 Tax=Sphingomonas populi TaxID=2484750 RepID=A0A4Q6XYT7_9SPHN|nr:alpha/beta hydrolase [Sphingomonas populi]RZF66033.1 alpha/beta hydrolase [Sphingomonas populi]